MGLTANESRTHLSPNDVFLTRTSTNTSEPGNSIPDHASMRTSGSKHNRDKRRNRSRSRRRNKDKWKKLLWIRQGYPDNYTDAETFLDALQRNPKLRPYDFWPLVADSTVIVQQVCTMIVFVCCFSGIFQERTSPVTVVSLGTLSTVLGWVLWDKWVGREEQLAAHDSSLSKQDSDEALASSPAVAKDGYGLGIHVQGNGSAIRPPYSRKTSSNSAKFSTLSEIHSEYAQSQSSHPQYNAWNGYGARESRLSVRNQQRFATAKSAILIYCILLGLSPILKSLTKSTASDSIWAISFWLMCMNVVFFDYSSGVGPTFPASLSTNAALMASTVLASRLPSTTHVFSLTLFSIEVFGLFPIFRRYLRYVSWRGHLLLTWFLVASAGGGVAIIMSEGGWKPAVLGVILSCIFTSLGMGLCSWWLISLQRFKNEIYGPWDPARPILRRWD